MTQSGSSNHFPDDPALELNEAERQRLNAFDFGVVVSQLAKTHHLRELARAKGLAAMNLEDLKSKSGKPFIEDDRQNTHRDYRTARTQEKEYEIAYLCCCMYFDDSKKGCGWVKGKPQETNYDEIGPMSGSAGFRQFCKICGTKIGETQLVIS